jgi:thioredoxin reductase
LASACYDALVVAIGVLHRRLPLQGTERSPGARAAHPGGRLEHGVELRTGVTVAQITTVGGVVTGVRLTDGSVRPADDVLVVIGSLPNTDWLAGSGPAH